MASPPSLPLPPPELASRVGSQPGRDPLDWYLREGARLRTLIEDLLPPGWDWEGKRALDFGCGSARVLRHFAAEAGQGEFHGCDIDEGSIAWNAANLSPPFHFFVSPFSPRLPLPDASLDLIWAMSVFTHITDYWSVWVLDMQRVLAPGGVLIASFLGPAMWPALVGQPLPEDEVGMAVLEHWKGPDASVLHSEWWLREHWGRAFDVLAVEHPLPSDQGAAEVTHSYIVLRRRDEVVTQAELERIDPAEEREVAGLKTAVLLARVEQMLLATREPVPSEGRRRPLRRLLGR